MTKKQRTTVSVMVGLILILAALIFYFNQDERSFSFPNLNPACAHEALNLKGEKVCLESKTAYTVVVMNKGHFCGVDCAWRAEDIFPNLRELLSLGVEVVFLTPDTQSAAEVFKLELDILAGPENYNLQLPRSALTTDKVDEWFLRDPDADFASATRIIGIGGLPLPSLILLAPGGQVLDGIIANESSMPSTKVFIEKVKEYIHEQ